MLVPITRQTFEDLIPGVATGEQYKYCWGKPRDFLKRLLVSAVCLAIWIFLEYTVEGDTLRILILIAGISSSLYWLWMPVWEASWRNIKYRKYPYAGFLQGKILDFYISEAVTEQQESVNKRGELIIIENLERRINVEVGDATGFSTLIQAPLNRNHKRLRRGQVAQMIVMSYLDDLSEINEVSDIYIPSQNLWISDYPYVRRDIFKEISHRFQSRRPKKAPASPQTSAIERYQPANSYDQVYDDDQP
jgi:hypothetical protein